MKVEIFEVSPERFREGLDKLRQNHRIVEREDTIIVDSVFGYVKKHAGQIHRSGAEILSMGIFDS